ncbi:alpha/beta hydrolase fold domain-containing protein, partial [Streptomyces sp. NPDC127079]|uniref:alpha/beta hydrolase fold domain-containing protein n=1 Tax=Streptomyces sp. NPDC127079 TaxID=3347132 RepID=UPI0036478281
IGAESLGGVAPALVVRVEVDALRDEGEQYAGALATAGVPVQQHRFDGLFHGALGLTAVIPEVQRLYTLIGGFFQEHAAKHEAVESA